MNTFNDPHFFTRSEISTRYNNTIGILNGNLVEVKYVEEEYIVVKSLNESDHVTLKHIPFTKIGTDLIFTNPKLGYINSGIVCFFVERSHKVTSNSRYRKGFSLERIESTNTSREELKKLSKHNSYPLTNLNKLVYDIFNAKYFDYEEAIIDIRNYKRLSVALSRTVCIKISFRSNKILLLRNNIVIGWFSNKKSKFILKSSSFVKELNTINVPYLIKREKL